MNYYIILIIGIILSLPIKGMEASTLSSWIAEPPIIQHFRPSHDLRIAQAAIDRLTKNFKSPSSPEMRLSNLSYILIHLLAKAEELEQVKHPEFLNAVLHIHGLKCYLKQMSSTDFIEPYLDRIAYLEALCKKRYIATIFNDENTSDSSQLTHFQRLNTLAYDAFSYEQLAHTLAKNHDHKGARTNRMNALDSLIQWAQEEKQHGKKKRAARALFKARIFLTHFDDIDEQKQEYLRSLQDTCEGLPVISVKNDP